MQPVDSVVEFDETVDDILGGDPIAFAQAHNAIAEAHDALAEASDALAEANVPISNSVLPVEAAATQPKRKKAGYWQQKNKQFNETGRAEFVKTLLEKDQAEFSHNDTAAFFADTRKLHPDDEHHKHNGVRLVIIIFRVFKFNSIISIASSSGIL